MTMSRSRWSVLQGQWSRFGDRRFQEYIDKPVDQRRNALASGCCLAVAGRIHECCWYEYRKQKKQLVVSLADSKICSKRRPCVP